MGVLSNLRDWTKNKIIGAIKSGYKLIGSPAFIKMRNKLTAPIHPDDPPLFNNERHLITGNLRNYRFAGPGTQVQQRLKLGGKYATPINELDALAKTHDIEFSRKMTPDEEFASDRKLVDGAIKLTSKIPEAKYLAAAIASKMGANKTGVLPWGTFT